MTVQVRVFAGLAELFQQDTIDVNVTPPIQLRDLREALLEQYPRARAELAHALLAVNQTYAPEHQLLQEGDEIALIPPVGGGDTYPSCRISDEPFSVMEAYEHLESTFNGGTVLFCGTVREFTGQRKTLKLTYQSYTEMALTQMRTIEAEIQAQYPKAKLLQWHRVGDLLPGDVAVVCAASSPHRNDAFEAARLLIERLKQEVAIWKKEHFADGEAKWQPNEEV